VTRGPLALTAAQKGRLLGDPWALSWVHSHLWNSGLAGSYAPILRDERGAQSDGSAAIGYPAAA